MCIPVADEGDRAAAEDAAHQNLRKQVTCLLGAVQRVVPWVVDEEAGETEHRDWPLHCGSGGGNQ
jgi:hypothetical protein